MTDKKIIHYTIYSPTSSQQGNYQEPRKILNITILWTILKNHPPNVPSFNHNYLNFRPQPVHHPTITNNSIPLLHNFLSCRSDFFPILTTLMSSEFRSQPPAVLFSPSTDVNFPGLVSSPTSKF